MICLELVSPSVTKLQSSLFLWVAASTLPTDRNLTQHYLVFWTQCPMWTWDRIIHFHRNFPKATIPAHHFFSCTVSSFHFPLNFSQIHTPNFICHCCALCFPNFLPPKILVHSVAVLFCRHLVFPYMLIISEMTLQLVKNAQIQVTFALSVPWILVFPELRANHITIWNAVC